MRDRQRDRSTHPGSSPPQIAWRRPHGDEDDHAAAARPCKRRGLPRRDTRIASPRRHHESAGASRFSCPRDRRGYRGTTATRRSVEFCRGAVAVVHRGAPEPAAIPIDGRLRAARRSRRPRAGSEMYDRRPTAARSTIVSLLWYPLSATISCRPSSSGAACAASAQRPRSVSTIVVVDWRIRSVSQARRSPIDRMFALCACVRPSLSSRPWRQDHWDQSLLEGCGRARQHLPRRGLDAGGRGDENSLPPYPVHDAPWRRWIPRWWRRSRVRPSEPGGLEALLDRRAPDACHRSADGSAKSSNDPVRLLEAVAESSGPAPPAPPMPR